MGTPINAGEPMQLIFAPDPSLAVDHLDPPFIEQLFWDGTKVVPRPGQADRFEVQVNLNVRSQQAGGTITANNADLLKPAGVNERVTRTMRFETLVYVQANGAKLMLTSDVPASIFKESVVVAPQSTYLPRST